MTAPRRHLVLATLVLVFGTSSTHSGMQGSGQEEVLVRKVLATYEDSWNRHDMEIFASVFTKDCDYVNIAGRHWKGVDENVRQHAALFQGRLAGVIQSATGVQIRFLKPDVALVHATWDVSGYTRPSGEKNRCPQRNHDDGSNQRKR